MSEKFREISVPREKIKRSEQMERKNKRIVALAKELVEKRERFSFSSIDSESYAKLKADDEELAGLCTPIDDLILRFKAEGMRVALGEEDTESGNIYILPFGSEDLENDAISLHYLNVEDIADVKLRELVSLKKEWATDNAF